MLRQIYIFHKGEVIFNYNYALGLGNEEFLNVKKLIQTYLDAPMPGKTFHRPVSSYQIFHRGAGTSYYLFIVDLADAIDYVDKIMQKTMEKVKELFPILETIKESSPNKNRFFEYLKEIQAELHSKIVIVGPSGAGRTTLYNMLRSPNERPIMNFAMVSSCYLDDLTYDLWDFQLKDNFSLLWGKFIGGADLTIIIFDLSNFHLKTITHYLNLQKREGRFSRLLILANKNDLISSDEEIRRIKNELDLPDMNEISLMSPDGRIHVTHLIRDVLQLKKPLPQNFGQLIQDAEKLNQENNLIPAIQKYKELLQICDEYQESTYSDTFEEKLDDLQNRRKEQIEQEKEVARKSKYSAPKQIKFDSKVAVKALPGVKPLPGAKPLPATGINKPGLKKLTLSPGDIQIKIPPKQNAQTQSLKPIQFQPHTLNITDEIVSNPNFNFAGALKQLIEEKGTTLSIELCEEYIQEMLDALERPLTVDDLNQAASAFEKAESQ